MPVVILIILALFCVYFADGPAYAKVLKGLVHCAVHCGCIIGTFYVSHEFTYEIGDHRGKYVARGLLYLVFGYLFGSFVMGLYLLMSAMFGFHWNEAFSSLQNENYKHFLRMHINPDGSLEVFCIGIQRPNKKWETSKYGPGDYKSSLIIPKKDYPTKLVDYVKMTHLDSAPAPPMSVSLASSSSHNNNEMEKFGN